MTVVYKLDAMGVLDLSEVNYEHSRSYAHGGNWPKSADKCWFALMTAYRTSKDQDRTFLTHQDDELPNKYLIPGSIIERGYNKRQSGKYGEKLRTYYIIEKVTESWVEVSVFDTPRRAFVAREKKVEEPAL